MGIKSFMERDLKNNSEVPARRTWHWERQTIPTMGRDRSAISTELSDKVMLMFYRWKHTLYHGELRVLKALEVAVAQLNTRVRLSKIPITSILFK
jgi:hypothetical protein